MTLLIPVAGKYTIYFPGGAFDLRGYYGTSIYYPRTAIYPILHSASHIARLQKLSEGTDQSANWQ